MPSPFPGMDPYLESPELWPDVRHELISQLRGILNQKIRPQYVARVELRVYLSDVDDSERDMFVPDLKVEKTYLNSASDYQGSCAEASASIMMMTKFTDEIEEPRVEILDVSEKRVVTVIEVLSPSNKRRGSRGQKEFMEKRREVMDSPSHWVEIDLLRVGKPTFTRARLPACDYAVHVSREHQRPRGQIWPIRLTDPLPRISIPQLPEDKEVTIDLGEILRQSYETAAYDLTIDYKSDPVPPLNPDAAVWADVLLKEKGLR